MNEITIADIRGLTTAQYDRCKTQAESRVQSRAGDKPRRRAFTRELEPLWGILDMAALLVLLSAWLVSSAHILTHVGQSAYTAYQSVTPAQYSGWLWGISGYGLVHQLGYIVLAESAMVLFMTMYAAGQGWQWRRVIPLALALGSALFVVIANWQSGVGELESILPPAVTIGLGFWLEGKLAEQLKRQQAVTARYLEAVERYELAQQDIDHHPDYLPYLRQELAQKILSLKPQRDYTDVPVDVLRRAVARELYRDQWAYESEQQPAAEVINPTPGAMSPTPVTYGAPSARENGRRDPARVAG